MPRAPRARSPSSSATRPTTSCASPRRPAPAATGAPAPPGRALVFDSAYDQYRGVVAFVRVVDGVFRPRERVRAMAQGTRFEAGGLGGFSPARRAQRSAE